MDLCHPATVAEGQGAVRDKIAGTWFTADDHRAAGAVVETA